MQTFLPYVSFLTTARVLDQKRLGKQRVEAKQIVQTIIEGREAWGNHPAVRMWRFYPRLLCLYGYAMCQEWMTRGFEDNLRSFFLERIEGIKDEHDVPWWLGKAELHRSHKSMLYQKDPVYYGAKFGRQPTLPYYWPT